MSKEKLTRFESISGKIREAIKTDANQKALDIVVNTSVEKEVESRSEIILKGLKVWAETDKAIKKCRPDQSFYPAQTNEDGSDNESNVKQEFYSEGKKKELDNLKKKLSDLDVALMNALGEKQDYSKLKQLTGGN